MRKEGRQDEGWLIWMARHRYAILSGALVLRLVTVPVMEAMEGCDGLPLKMAAEAVQALLMFFACILAVGRSRTLMALGLAVLGAGLLAGAKFLGTGHHVLVICRTAFVCGMAIWGIVHLMTRTFRAQVVSSSNLHAAAAIYLLMGFAFANVYELVQVIQPSAFNVTAVGGVRSDTFLYFSFITLTTVGYGDVLPLSGVARMLAVTEALMGQVYLVLSVSRLVGLHVAHSTVPKSTD